MKVTSLCCCTWNAAVTMMYSCTISMMYIANDTPPKYRILIGYWRHPFLFTTSHMVSVNMAQLLLSRWDVDQAIRLKTSYSQHNIIINNWKLLNNTLTHAIVYGLMVDYNQKHKNIWLMKIIKLFDASSLVRMLLIPRAKSYFVSSTLMLQFNCYASKHICNITVECFQS